MGTLTVVLTLVMLLSAVGFVVGGLVLAEGVLRPPAREGAPAVSRTRKVGALFLLALGCILVVVAIATGALIADREARLIELQGTVSQLESRIQALEGKLGRDLSGPGRPATQTP